MTVANALGEINFMVFLGNALADPRGEPGMLALAQSNFLYFHACFQEILDTLKGYPPPGS